MIRVRSLSVAYGPVQALQALDFDLDGGECVLVTGPSGCGKSTLARVLTGLIPHAIPAFCEGEVEVAGLCVRDRSISEIAQRVGMVFQNPSSQLFHLRVEDEVAFGPRNHGLSEPDVIERVDWALNAVGIKDLRQSNPAKLSGGQKQRVAIAAALAMRPQVLVLDEPTASLDVSGTRYVITALHELRKRIGITIVLIEHRLGVATHLADRAVVMDGGQIISKGAVERVFRDREVLNTLGLRRMVKEPQAPWRELLSSNQHSTSGSTPLIEMQGVDAGYDRRPVIQNVDLKLFRGDFIALVGENGAGKSTLALATAGLLKPLRGRVQFDGGRRPQPGRDVSMLFQDPYEQLFTDSVDEEIAFGPRNFRCFDAQNHIQTLTEADLLDLRSRAPNLLSVGQQQRTALGACLSLRPRLLILDEPTLGQDWGHLERLMDYVVRLNQQGTTIILITHDYKLVHHYARRVILMEYGKIVLDGCLRNRLDHPVLLSHSNQEIEN